MSKEVLSGKQKVIRQNLSNRINHWLVAISTFALIFSGFGQMPMYKRYGVASLPGLGWSADFHLTLVMHYIAGVVLISAGVFHLVYVLATRKFHILPRRGDLKESLQIVGAMCKLCKAPGSHKYLAEQRLAYAYIGLTLALIAVTGIIKVYKNAPGVNLSQDMLLIVTNLHNLAAILLLLGIFGHLAAFAFKENRALLSAMFSGCVELDYVRERHIHWYSDLVAAPERLQRSLCTFKKGLAQHHNEAS